MKSKRVWLAAGLTLIFVFVTVGIIFAGNGESPIPENIIKQQIEEQYGGKVTSLSLKTPKDGRIYELELASQTGRYRVVVNADSGEVLDLTMTRAEPVVTAPSSSEMTTDQIRKIVEEKTDGSVVSIEKATENKKTSYIAVADTKSGRTTLTLDSQGRIVDQKTESAEKDPAPKTVISEKEARSIAQKKMKGTITAITLEENGDQPEYRVDIESSGGSVTVIVNAYSGNASVNWKTDDVDRSKNDDQDDDADDENRTETDDDREDADDSDDNDDDG